MSSLAVCQKVSAPEQRRRLETSGLVSWCRLRHGRTGYKSDDGDGLKSQLSPIWSRLAAVSDLQLQTAARRPELSILEWRRLSPLQASRTV